MDIVERLRTVWEDSGEIASWMRRPLSQYEAAEAAEHIRTMHKALHEAADEIERLRAEVAALKKDADRYRWLRSSFRVARWDVKYWTGEFWDVMYGDAMDKQIDAALGGEEGKDERR